VFILDSNNFYQSTIVPTSISHGFGTKRSDIKKLLGEKDRVVIPRQVHSDVIEYVDTVTDCGPCDGLYTQKNKVILTVQTADCVPIIFIDAKEKLVGISHQGWKGTLHMLAVKMVKKFVDVGSDKEDIIVAIGPSIGPCCYELFGERKKMFEQAFPHFIETIIETRANKTYLNLSKLNYVQLTNAGISEKNIDHFPFCTNCNADMFYSNYRNDMAKEMINFVVRK